MTPNANAKHFRLKAAQRDLIAACGGIERAAEICSFSKSTVGRWAKIDQPEIMDPAAVDALETETGLRLWTTAWLAGRGLKLADEDVASEGACLQSEMGAFLGAVGSLCQEWATIQADGHATPAEADSLLRRHLPEVVRAVDGLKDASAGVIAAGGASLFRSRVVGGGQR
jgi:hypothetical protein